MMPNFWGDSWQFNGRHTILLQNLLDSGWVEQNPGWLSDIPIWQVPGTRTNSYRKTLITKLLNHYRTYEIGSETPALFAHYLETALNEIMPEAIQIYNTTLIKFDPLKTLSTSEVMDREGTVNTASEANSSEDTASHVTGSSDTSNSTKNENHSTGKTAESDTPQNFIQTLDSLDWPTWASRAGASNDNTNGAASGNSLTNTSNDQTFDTTRNANAISNSGTTDDYIKTIEGFTKHPSEMIQALRDLIVDMDIWVIKHPEISSCFYKLW